MRAGKPPSGRDGAPLGILVAATWACWRRGVMMADARARRCTRCYDFGYLAGLVLPVSLVWYLFWSRGPRGAWVQVLLVCPWIVPAILVNPAGVLARGPALGIGPA